MPWGRWWAHNDHGDGILKVTVIGAGTMGSGIAQVFAQKGHEVVLTDIYEPAIENAKKTIPNSLQRLKRKGIITEDESAVVKRIDFTKELSSGKGSDLFIEAVIEKPETKTDLFGKISDMADETSIIASNTSSISINYLSGFVNNPKRFVGIHFFNPPPVMKLVEIVKANSTSEETIERALSISKSLDKEPVVVKDFPGFVSNRVLMPLIREAILTLEEGIATTEDIDKTLKLGMNHPMGPLELADLIGLDVTYDIMDVLYREYGDPRFKPPITLRNLVNSKRLGRKTGEGFYKY